MNKTYLKLSHQSKSILIILTIFVVISLAYFPVCLQNKVLDASDYNVFSGASKELKDFRKSTGEESLWTNSMFGGMPSYLVLTHYKGNIFQYYFTMVSKIPVPLNHVIINFCMFFILGLVFGANPWISFAGALAYGFSTFIFILLNEGHVTKVQSLSYIPLIIGGIYLAYNNQLLKGGILTAIGLALNLSVNHMQMTFYAGIVVLIMQMVYLIYAWKEKTIVKFLMASGVLFCAALLAIGISFGPLLTTWEYGKYSVRGKSDLVSPTNKEANGLNPNYILDLSYDVSEAVTAFIPRFKGGSGMEALGEESSVFQLLEKKQGNSEAKRLIQNTPLYWGSQKINKGPFYYGAVFCFLFVLGLFVIKGKEKWWILSVVVVSFFLSLGKNVPLLSNFMIEHIPGYGKFRDVKNIIFIQHFAMAVMGLITVKAIYLRSIDTGKFLKAMKYSFAIAGGLAFLFVLIPSLAGNFYGNSDANLVEMGWPQEFIQSLIKDRREVVRADAFRTFVFISLAAIVLLAFWYKKLKAQYALCLWVILILADMWPIDKRYLNNDNFVTKKIAEVPFRPTIADGIIMQDKDPDFRVLNLSLNPFTDTSTSYYHKSVGGNHGAKLKRFQEMITFNISLEIDKAINRLEKIKTQEELDKLFSELNALNMLNTRYLIFNPDAEPLRNNFALGNAWFVDNIRMVDNADEEVKAIKEINPKTTAVIDRKYEKFISGKAFKTDPASSIKLTSYAPNKLVYQSNCTAEQLALFSEIYYPKGWVVTIDGTENNHFSANYILRSMVVPAGKHEIVFEFKPQSYKIGNAVSLASSALLILIVCGAVLTEIMKRRKLRKLGVHR